MKKIMIAILLCCATAAMADSTASYDVVPLPQKIVLSGKAPFVMTAASTIAYSEGDDVAREALFLQEYIRDITGMELAITTDVGRRATGVIRLQIDDRAEGDEGYTIAITEREMTLSSKTAAGIFYAIQTIRKALLGAASSEVTFPSGVITDAPRFAYRGMMLDCSRHIFSIDFIKEYIDLIAMHNMNRFHWHLTDDQGWRIEMKKYPRLTEIGSCRAETTIGHNSQIYDRQPYGGYYTQDEARQIVVYAKERHIVVIPEIDMPGHQLSVLASYPELGCTGGPYEVGRNWEIYSDILCLGNDDTYRFCCEVLDEIMSIFPSEYIHIGGDEAPIDVVAQCDKCRQLMEREGLTTADVQGYFTNRIEQFVTSRGRHIIGWDEILEGDIDSTAVVHCWRGIDRAVEAIKKGHDVILSPTSHCYFDYYQADPATHHEPPAIGGLTTVEQVYALRTLLDSLQEELRGGTPCLGLQGNLWTEYIGATSHVEYMVLPRMAALCEAQWCEAMEPFEDFYQRLSRLTLLYDLYDLSYARHLWSEEQ